ncbi:MAG: RHS repeat-associated core domain-containing protein, partial [Polyangiaceae bacterium]|nr:RHS repeat-associated core domain-containing protein [Polyangiaceae bacterium]
FDQPYVRSDHDWDDLMPAGQGPLAGRPSWTKDRAGTVVLGYDPHGWAVWSGRQITPDVTTGYFSQSTFDEGQRLLAELNPDISEFRYQYTSRGLLWSVDFYEAGATAPQPLVRETYYDVQGRKVEVEYGDRYCTDPSSCPEPDLAEGTRETYSYDSRQRLARKRAVRADDLVLLDYRYTYDSASNIVRIDDGRIPCWVAGATSVDPVATCPAPGPDVSRFVTYDVTYSYDALYRLTKATPFYKLPEEDRVGEQRWSFDALGSMASWTDPADHFYGWSLGNIVNGLQVSSDPGLGPLPEDPERGCQVDLLDRCVVPRLSPAPHALYSATSTTGDDELAAFYDAAGNMAALVVHRPRGCEQENDTGGPDGLGCKEGETFALFFAWDEVGNLLAADRRSPVISEHADTPPEPGCTLDPDPLPFLGAVTGQYVWWCPAASLQSAYDFGNQRRVKVETYHDGNPWDLPDGYSLYVSANYERRKVDYDDPTKTYGGEGAIDARYARDGLATTWELDSEGPDGSVLGKYRLTLTNHLSSIGVVLDASVGAPLRHFSQLPYGAEEKVVAPVGWEAKDVGRYEFTGKERDHAAGLMYFGARSASPQLGRWSAADPHLHGSQPNDQNPYRFSGASPLAFVDPDGRDIYVYDALQYSISSLAAATDSVKAELLHRAAGTVHSNDPNIQSGAVAEQYVWRAMQAQAAALGGGDALAAELFRAFDGNALSVTHASGASELRQNLLARFGAQSLVIFEQFYQAAGTDATAVVVRVRDDPAHPNAAQTAMHVAFAGTDAQGNTVTKEGQMAIVPLGGAYHPETGRFSEEADLVGAEIVHHVGGSVVGEEENQSNHGGLFQRLLKDAVAGSPGPTPDPNTSDLAPFAYRAVQWIYKEKPTAADERALAWGQAVRARDEGGGNNARVPGAGDARCVVPDNDVGAAGGTQQQH